MTMDISDQEVWLRGYCAALAGAMANETTARFSPRTVACLAADYSLEDFKKKFPPFKSASSEHQTASADEA
jgi:hypothetical protein